MTLELNLVFNWVIFLRDFNVQFQTSSNSMFNGKFCSFLVRVRIQKDNTDCKFLKRNFIQKKQEKKI